MSLRALTLKSAVIPSLGLGIRSTRIGIRNVCTSTPEDPKSKASAILNALPGNSALSKTGILATSAAAVICAISNQFYVINAETILLGTFSGVVFLIVKFLAPAYKEFADERIKKVANILNSSRDKHIGAVKDRINSVSELQNVAEITKILFDVSKETLELEAKSFELKQRVDVAAEAKAVLDSWIRYEASVAQLQQKKIAESVITRVQAELANPKFQDKFLQQAVSDVEKFLVDLK